MTDDGMGGTVTEGHGLIGIRERVSMYDGSFPAGPRSGRGFEVVVRLPYQRAGVKRVSDIRVLVADDQALLRGSFRVLIDTTPGPVTVGEAADGAEAVAVAHREQPDVVLMDVRIHG